MTENHLQNICEAFPAFQNIFAYRRLIGNITQPYFFVENDLTAVSFIENVTRSQLPE